MSSRDLLIVLGFKKGEEIDNEGNKSTYHLILEFIWKKIRNKVIYFSPKEFQVIDVTNEELESYLSRLLDIGILRFVYRVDCPECDAPHKEIDNNPLSLWGEGYRCPLCNNDNQILLEDISCFYKFDTQFREKFQTFFFLPIYPQKRIQNRVLLL